MGGVQRFTIGEPVRGYKAFQLGRGGLVTGQDFVDTFWDEGEAHAICGRRGTPASFTAGRWPTCEVAPGEDCQCGIHVADELVDALLYRRNSPFAVAVYGRVALSGKVIVHEHGARGEYGRIEELWIERRDAHRPLMAEAREALARYGVPVGTITASEEQYRLAVERYMQHAAREIERVGQRAARAAASGRRLGWTIATSESRSS